MAIVLLPLDLLEAAFYGLAFSFARSRARYNGFMSKLSLAGFDIDNPKFLIFSRLGCLYKFCGDFKSLNFANICLSSILTPDFFCGDGDIKLFPFFAFLSALALRPGFIYGLPLNCKKSLNDFRGCWLSCVTFDLANELSIKSPSRPSLVDLSGIT